jgi:hypothetical protein
MGEKGEKKSSVMIKRAPVLTLWAAVVAEVLGFEHAEALTLGRAVAGLNAYSKGVSLGLFQPTPKKVQEQRRRILLRSTGRNFFHSIRSPSIPSITAIILLMSKGLEMRAFAP